MNLPIHPDFTSTINAVQLHLRQAGNHVETETWQAKKNPPMFYEALNVSFSSIIPPYRRSWIDQIKPNIPWADDHFHERVGGKPLNPGDQYKNWPPYKNNPSNDTSRTAGGGQFSHTYMERIWPKFAGYKLDGYYTNYVEWKKTILDPNQDGYKPHKGIRYDYGDLESLVNLLIREPFTRQAYLPIWFPEDTGAESNQRVPCTLGYHFIRRGENLHVNYYIRSCDFIRHFRDDIYLCLRMVEWLLVHLRPITCGNSWLNVTPGIFTMHITSLHIFSKEYNLLKD